jgi:hypothetical protein
MNQKKGVDVSHLLSRLTIGLARRSPLVAGAALVVVLAACGSDSTTGPSSGSSSTPIGSYTMSTVNGKAVPTSIFADGGFSYDVTGGSMKLTTDGKFSAITNTRQTLPGRVENFVDTTSGTWTQTGSAIAMTLSDGSTASATWDKTTLTLTSTDQGISLTVVYGNKK